jgi:ElaB/YqjD/DUF883 family membrane-anchored ribosome-binding protein
VGTRFAAGKTMSNHHHAQGQPKSTNGITELPPIKEAVDEVVSAGAEQLRQIEKDVVEAKNDFVAASKQYLGELEKQVRAAPLASVAIAFGVGYIAMRIFR